MPPALGIAAPNSAAERAPSSETAPPTTQTSIVGSDPPRVRAITLGTMKMADAMIVPTLIIVESSSPSWRLRSAIRRASSVWPLWSEPVVFPQGGARPVCGQAVHGEVVGASHGLRRQHGVDDRLLGGLHGRLEQWRDLLVRYHGDLREPGVPRGAGVGRRERDEDVARRIGRDRLP